MLTAFRKIFSSSNDRVIKKMMRHVKNANILEDDLSKNPDEYFLNIKDELQKIYIENKEDIYSILPMAFAVVREASKRTLGLRHFDSQMLGGISLAEGNIAEMKTGEGKTLVATLPAYLNAVIGNKAILVTVNDYLAKRDAEWMRPIYEFLGLSVGIVISNQDIDEKIASYKSNVIYATNNELGFDYLRDNMSLSVENRVQCSLDFAIVDEVDSILIDEARTPLIISGPSSESSQMYIQIKKFIPKLIYQKREGTEDEPLMQDEKGHYLIDEKNRSVELTDDGYVLVESFLEENGLIGKSEVGTYEGLYSISNLKIMKFVQATLKASFLFKKNVHYLVRNNEVLLIDEHTGRTMPGRRISEGVHQALECKENVPIQRESQTLASTTFQNFFRLFNKLSGMTGTADTEAVEFQQIYGLSVIIIPTNLPMIRDDHNDLVFLTKKAKYKALIDEIESIRSKSAPVLVGTVSVESSEEVSQYLNNKNIPHQILNAKHHEKEAEIIANAGKPGMVTIATNMAGRGTDIQLGGINSDIKEQVKLTTEKELLIYSYRVAGTVGLMMAKILKVNKKNSLKSAIDLGIAMQLTNISRDVIEDFNNNRIYIDQNFENIKSTIELSEKFYENSFNSIKEIPLSFRFSILVARRVYRKIGYKILNKKNFENYKKSGKIYVNNVEKIVETLLAIIDLLKLVLTNKNDDNIDHDHYLINEEIKLNERI